NLLRARRGCAASCPTELMGGRGEDAPVGRRPVDVAVEPRNREVVTPRVAERVTQTKRRRPGAPPCQTPQKRKGEDSSHVRLLSESLGCRNCSVGMRRSAASAITMGL